jgi:hypothetical protein
MFISATIFRRLSATTSRNTNGLPNLDTINNVENIILPPMLAGSYSVTVVGRAVNVNAVTAQTNNAAGVYAPNVVQDYALVVSIGEGEVTGAFTVTDAVALSAIPRVPRTSRW